MNIIDLHSHHPFPYPAGIISCSPEELPTPEAAPGQLYSVGFHPWSFTINGFPDDQNYIMLEDSLKRPDVVALGECGIDFEKGGPLALQRITFRRQAEIANAMNLPLIIHNVKAHEHIIGCYKDLKPTVNWAIHGFRGKTSVAEMLLKAGLWLSFGPKFNPDSLRITPDERILAETDDSGIPIDEVIRLIEEVKGKAMRNQLGNNLYRFLNGEAPRKR